MSWVQIPPEAAYFSLGTMLICIQDLALSSLVGKSIAWKAKCRGGGMTVSGELCSVALPFCCVVAQHLSK